MLTNLGGSGACSPWKNNWALWDRFWGQFLGQNATRISLLVACEAIWSAEMTALHEHFMHVSPSPICMLVSCAFFSLKCGEHLYFRKCMVDYLWIFNRWCNHNMDCGDLSLSLLQNPCVSYNPSNAIFSPSKTCAAMAILMWWTQIIIYILLHVGSLEPSFFYIGYNASFWLFQTLISVEYATLKQSSYKNVHQTTSTTLVHF